MTGGTPTRPIVCVDAFTTQPFTGNPAAVCLLDEDIAEERMQALAAELNLSETAFVLAGGDGFGLRWFTPTQEVQLCGHATLASAHVLFETGRVAREQPARFHTRWKGELTARCTDDGIALDFPATPTAAASPAAGLAAALGTELGEVGVNELHHVVELADAGAVRALTPDHDALRRIEGVDAVAVTAASDEPGYDFVSRYFAPRYGIPEDPVTGSAHTSLGPWWSERLGRNHLVGHQVSRRGGTVRVTVDAPRPGRVTLEGAAVTVWRGDLVV